MNFQLQSGAGNDDFAIYRDFSAKPLSDTSRSMAALAYVLSFSFSRDLFSSRKARRPSAESSRRIHCS